MRRAQPWRTNRSRTLRANQTRAEDVLWQHLRGRRLAGYKFVQQLPIGEFFTDIACRAEKLAIEIDGSTHATDQALANDARRSAAIPAQGYRILRVLYPDVFENAGGVLDEILLALKQPHKVE